MAPDPVKPDCAPRSAAGIISKTLIGVAAAAAAVYLLMRSGELASSLSVARRLAWGVLLAGVVAQFFSYLCAGQLQRVTVRQTGHALRLSRATMMQIAAATLSMLPGGSVSCTPAVYRWTRNEGVPGFSAAVSGVVTALFNATSMLAFALLSAVLLIGQHRLEGKEAVALAIVGIGIAAMITVAIVAATWPPALRFMLAVAGRIPLLRRSSLLRRADDRVAQFRATVSKLRNGRWGAAAASAALNVAFDAATLALVFYAAGVRINPAILLAGYGLPIMLGQASFLPGGLAVTEVSMSAAFISMGLHAPVVIASVIAYRLVSLWLPALAGLPLIAYLQMLGRRQTRSGAQDGSSSALIARRSPVAR